MPIIKSAKKRLRQSKKRRIRNKSYEGACKIGLKKLRTGTKKEALTKAYKTIDKAAKKGVIHKKKANRLKSKAFRAIHVKTKSVK